MSDQDGRFELRTDESSAEVPAGDYEVVVVEDLGPIDNQKKPSLALKYRSPSASGLQFTVETGEVKTLAWKLERP